MRFLSGSRDGGSVSRLPARLVVITCLILVFSVILLAWTRESGNSDAREAEAARIKGAIETELHKLALDAVEFANGALAAEQNNSTTQQAADRNRVAIVELGRPFEGQKDIPAGATSALAVPLMETGNLLAHSLRGGVSENEAPATPALRLYTRNTLSGFAELNGVLSAWVLVPAHLDAPNGMRRAFAVLALEAADSGFAARVAVSARAGYVEVRSQPEDAAGVHSLRYGNHGEPVFVSWRPDRPGDRLTTQLGALLISIMAVYTGFVAYFMTRRLAESEYEKARLATQDSLTGTANRLLMTIQIEDQILRARRSGRSFALLYLDFDRFKEINDTYGHDAGDKMIILASRRIEETIGPDDRLARFGGDEFGVIQHDVSSLRDCEQLAERLLAKFAEPFSIDGRELYIGASIGIAVSQKGDEDRAELMRRADLALYRAKNQGRGRYVFYDEAMNSELHRQKTLEDELRRAMRNGEFEVHYQPIVEARTHKLSCVEALVRWNHPERGIVPPGEFIALAEERGLIVELGEFVMRQGCRDALHWPGVRLAVNISALQFRHKDFVAGIARVLSETGFDPSRLEIEMTESVVIDNAEQAAEAIAALRATGIRIALDDFGTGYSSLIYLRRFAIDKIKIDRSFVELMEASNESREIVRNVIDLGRRLGLTVTAEGVENEQQIAGLEEFGCNELQGYYFGKPVTQLGIPALIAADRVGGAKTQKSDTRAA